MPALLPNSSKDLAGGCKQSAKHAALWQSTCFCSLVYPFIDPVSLLQRNFRIPIRSFNRPLAMELKCRRRLQTPQSRKFSIVSITSLHQTLATTPFLHVKVQLLSCQWVMSRETGTSRMSFTSAAAEAPPLVSLAPNKLKPEQAAERQTHEHAYPFIFSLTLAAPLLPSRYNNPVWMQPLN